MGMGSDGWLIKTCQGKSWEWISSTPTSRFLRSFQPASSEGWRKAGSEGGCEEKSDARPQGKDTSKGSKAVHTSVNLPALDTFIHSQRFWHMQVKPICMYTQACVEIYVSSLIYTNILNKIILPVTDWGIFSWNTGLCKPWPWGFLLALKESLIL